MKLKLLQKNSQIMNPVRQFILITAPMSLCFLQAGHSVDIGDRIRGGSAVTEHLYPYYVRVFSKVSSCGGVLVELDKVITALHCVGSASTSWNYTTWFDASDFILSAGEITLNVSDELLVEQRRYASQVVRATDVYSLDEDIALLVLDKPFIETEYVSPIRMCTEEEEDDQSLGLLIVGMGVDEIFKNSSVDYPVYLQELDMVEESLDYCYETLRYNETAPVNSSNADALLCAIALESTNDTACSGDSGSGLVKVDINHNPMCVVAVFSSAFLCIPPEDDHASLYVRLRNYEDLFNISDVDRTEELNTSDADPFQDLNSSDVDPFEDLNSSDVDPFEDFNSSDADPFEDFNSSDVDLSEEDSLSEVSTSTPPAVVSEDISKEEPKTATSKVVTVILTQAPPRLPIDYDGAQLIKGLHYRILLISTILTLLIL